MGCLEDDLTEYRRMSLRDQKIEKLSKALQAMVDRWEPDCGGLDRVMWENANEALAFASSDARIALAEHRDPVEFREECAKLVEAMIPERKPGTERMVLAIAAKAIRRGRHLTAEEGLLNLAAAMDEADSENGTQENAGVAAKIREAVSGSLLRAATTPPPLPPVGTPEHAKKTRENADWYRENLKPFA